MTERDYENLRNCIGRLRAALSELSHARTFLSEENDPGEQFDAMLGAEHGDIVCVMHTIQRAAAIVYIDAERNVGT